MGALTVRTWKLHLLLFADIDFLTVRRLTRLYARVRAEQDPPPRPIDWSNPRNDSPVRAPHSHVPHVLSLARKYEHLFLQLVQLKLLSLSAQANLQCHAISHEILTLDQAERILSAQAARSSPPLVREIPLHAFC